MSKYNDVNKHNITQLLPALKLIIKKSSFIAIDTEFTGLGNQSTKQKDLGQRYESLSEHVSTHALIAFGLSLFIQDKKLSASFKVYNFSFSLLCQTAYKVCPSSMQFLIGNGFDFNQQFSTGIPYRPGNDSVYSSFYLFEVIINF